MSSASVSSASVSSASVSSARVSSARVSKAELSTIVDLDRYPIQDRNHAKRAQLVEQCKGELDTLMYCAIPDFVCSGALKRMAQEAEELRPQAYDNNSIRNCYLQRQGDASLPEDHARNHLINSSTRMLAYDQIERNSPLKRFYHSNEVRALIAEIVGAEVLFDNEDPYQPANYVCYNEGDRSSWHFDADNSFTVTLMVQAAESGGEFQMSVAARSDTDQNYLHVAQVLRGERNETIKSVARTPGALCIFRGCNALHRVSEVSGKTMRIMGVFVYEREAGIVGDREVNETIYGSRVVALE